MSYEVGEKILLSLKLFDENATKFVRARVYNPAGALVYTRTLPHIADGLYQDYTQIMTSSDFLTAIYSVFDDAGFLAKATEYQDSEEVLFRDDGVMTGTTIVHQDEVVITAVETDEAVIIVMPEEEEEIITEE